MSLRIVTIALVAAACGAEPPVSRPTSSEFATEARAAVPLAATGDSLRLVTHWVIAEGGPLAAADIDLSRMLASVTIDVHTPAGRAITLRPRVERLDLASVPVSRSSGALWLIDEGGLWLAPLVDGPLLGPLPWTDPPTDLLALPGRYRVTLRGELPLGDRTLPFASPAVTMELAPASPALRPLADLDRRARLAVATSHQQLDQGHAPAEITGGPADAIANPAGNRVLRYRTVDRAGLDRAWQVTIRPSGEVVGLEHAPLPACARTGSCAPAAVWQWHDPWQALYRPITARPG